MHRLLLGLTAFVLTGCGNGADRATLNYFFTYDPRSLDPALSTDVPTGEVVALLFDNLTQFDADAQLTPGLARSWETDAAGLSVGTTYAASSQTNACRWNFTAGEACRLTL